MPAQESCPSCNNKDRHVEQLRNELERLRSCNAAAWQRIHDWYRLIRKLFPKATEGLHDDGLPACLEVEVSQLKSRECGITETERLKLQELEKRFEGCGIDHEDHCSFDRLLEGCVEAAGLPTLGESTVYGGSGLRKGLRELRDNLEKAKKRISELEERPKGNEQRI